MTLSCETPTASHAAPWRGGQSCRAWQPLPHLADAMLLLPLRLFGLSVLLVVVALLASPMSASADTYTVRNTNDEGTGSLRQAMLNANAHSNALNGTDDGGFPLRDVIVFSILNCGQFGPDCTISPASPLPTITDPVVIDGWSQVGSFYDGRPVVEIDGTNAGAPADGLTISAGNSTVQGLAINRFKGSGIALIGGGSNLIVGSYVGTDPTGVLAKGNLLAGVVVHASAQNSIGGVRSTETRTVALPRNIISGNNVGIVLEGHADFNQVVNNYIGTDATGAAPLGNATSGILIADSTSTAIGWTFTLGNDSPFSLAGNVIAFNGGTGIAVASGDEASIAAGSVFGNGGLGIDLGLDGVTPNDALDGDSGPNGRQNAPVITSARAIDGGTRVSGMLDSSPNTFFDIQIYSSPTCDPSGFGEGQDLIAGDVPRGRPPYRVGTDARGHADFSFDVRALAPGQSVTATATTQILLLDPVAGRLRTIYPATSEYSRCRPVRRSGISVEPAGPLVTTEDGGSASFTVALKSQPAADVRIPLGSSNPREGTVSTPALVFTQANWSTPQTVTVAGVDDPVLDGDVPYQARIGPASSADSDYDGLDPADLSLTNRDNEDNLTVSIADVRVREGGPGPVQARFAVTLSGASANKVTVHYATADGTATAPGDYAATSGVLTFAPGETSQAITVQIADDKVAEPDETFTVRLSDPTAVALGTAQATGLIADDAGPSACSPRPNVKVVMSELAAGRFQVKVAAGSGAIQSIQFGTEARAMVNGRIEIDGRLIATTASVALAPNTTSTTFVAIKIAQGEAMMIPLIVTDGCGPWQTFVGQGTGP